MMKKKEMRGRKKIHLKRRKRMRKFVLVIFLRYQLSAATLLKKKRNKSLSQSKMMT